MCKIRSAEPAESNLGPVTIVNGYIDILDRYHIFGWVMTPTGPDKITIRVNGKDYAETWAAMEVDDLNQIYGHRAALRFHHCFDKPLVENDVVELFSSKGTQVGTVAVVPPESREDVSDIDDGITVPVPPPDLVFAVVGHWSQRDFAVHRRPAVNDIISKLAAVDIDYRSFKVILDFGCGCGRILAGWQDRLLGNTQLLGCDINPKLIDFCQQNIPFAKTFVSQHLPPLLPIHNESIDFFYAASVFTHLDESAARAWRYEIERVLSPNGVAMISFVGSSYEEELKRVSPVGFDYFKRRGFFMHTHNSLSEPTPGANEHATFISQHYFRALFDSFDILSVSVSQGFMSTHDVAVLRKSRTVASLGPVDV